MEWRVEFKHGEEGQSLARLHAVRDDGPNFVATFRYEEPDLTSVKVVFPLAVVRADTLEPLDLSPEVREKVFQVVAEKVAVRYDY